MDENIEMRQMSARERDIREKIPEMVSRISQEGQLLCLLSISSEDKASALSYCCREELSAAFGEGLNLGFIAFDTPGFAAKAAIYVDGSKRLSPTFRADNLEELLGKVITFYLEAERLDRYGLGDEASESEDNDNEDSEDAE